MTVTSLLPRPTCSGVQAASTTSRRGALACPILEHSAAARAISVPGHSAAHFGGFEARRGRRYGAQLKWGNGGRAHCPTVGLVLALSEDKHSARIAAAAAPRSPQIRAAHESLWLRGDSQLRKRLSQNSKGKTARGVRHHRPLERGPCSMLGAGGPTDSSSEQEPSNETPSGPEILWRRTIRELSSLPLAIGILFAVAGACALGTVIEQCESPATYIRDYPEDRPILGFLTWKVILGLGLDHVYTNPAFLGLLLLLAACLAACTSTRQFPMLKVARRWSFLEKPASILRQEYSESLPQARLSDVALQLQTRGYEVFQKNGSLYGFKGLVGRLAPIGVHAAMLLIMAGGTYSALGGFRGSVMIPQGLDVYVPQAVRGTSFLARPTSSMNMVMHLDDFRIEYRPTGEVQQFYSDLTMSDLNGREILRKTISVNDPLRCQGVTVYQTDWSITSVQLRVNDGEPFKLPMAVLEDGTSAKLYGTFLPLQGEEAANGRPRGITILARDLQSVVLYDADGAFVGVRRPTSKKPIKVEGVNVVLEDVIGGSGLELKMDPGVPLVYAGFGALMLTSFISYLSHSQIWAVQDGSTVHIGGKSNRAKLSFKDELSEIASSVPEIVQKKQDA